MIAALFVCALALAVLADWAWARRERCDLWVRSVSQHGEDYTAHFVDGEDDARSFDVGERAAAALVVGDRVVAEWWSGVLSGATYGLRITP